MSLWEQLLSVLFAGQKNPRVNLTWPIRGTGFVQPKIETFIEKFRPAGLAIEARFGIPWRFAMVQAAHESRYGESGLTVKANNLFGITGDTWQAQGKPVFVVETRECAKDGTPFVIKRPFRKYDSWQASLEDWASLIERRYPKAHLAARAGDFPGFAKGLEEGGYATDRDKTTGELVYAKKLVALNSSLEGIA